MRPRLGKLKRNSRCFRCHTVLPERAIALLLPPRPGPYAHQRGYRVRCLFCTPTTDPPPPQRSKRKSRPRKPPPAPSDYP